MTTTRIAEYIAPDTYTGKWTRGMGSASAAYFTAAELATLAPEGVVWESFGHPNNGREMFARTRYVADATGALHCYDSTGRKVITYPADRRLRILVNR